MVRKIYHCHGCQSFDQLIFRAVGACYGPSPIDRHTAVPTLNFRPTYRRADHFIDYFNWHCLRGGVFTSFCPGVGLALGLRLGLEVRPGPEVGLGLEPGLGPEVGLEPGLGLELVQGLDIWSERFNTVTAVKTLIN